MKNKTDIEILKYPIGRFEFPKNITPEKVETWINEISDMPGQLKHIVNSLNSDQLAAPYRPGGWTVRQLIHHIGDSHLNSLIRFKWALTESRPTIKAYDQDGWASVNDFSDHSVNDSLLFIKYLHIRFTSLLRSLSPEDLKREFIHPAIGIVKLKQNIALYAWHGKHHCTHISELVKREGWY
jgi:hypothetical protein